MESGDGFEVIKYIPASILPYDKPGITYTLVRLPGDEVQGNIFIYSKSKYYMITYLLALVLIINYYLVLSISATSTFSCTLKFIVKDCDPNTGEPDDDGYEDEYVVSSYCCGHVCIMSLNYLTTPRGVLFADGEISVP